MAVAEWASKQQERIFRLPETQPNRATGATDQDVEKLRGLVETLQDLLGNRLEAREAAERLASLILSHSDVDRAWNYMLGCLLNAAENFSGEKLVRLADLLACLASLPYALPTNELGVKTVSEEGRRFADLPRFGWGVRDRMNGPEAYLGYAIPTATATMAARERWRNINTFTAIFTHSYASTIPALSDYTNFALWTLASALEYDYTADQGEKVDLNLPAATQWVLIAGEQVFQAISQDIHARPGALWDPVGDESSVTKERWCFWQYRFAELAESCAFDNETMDAARKAAERMAAIYQGWD